MMQKKGPESIKTINLKGHATEEMVDKGVVRRVDKNGNDKANEAAGRGSHGEQRRLHALTTLYAERHEAYRIFMGRVQSFLVHMQKAEKDVWKQREQIVDPNFSRDKKRKSKKIKATKSLKYAENKDDTQERASSSTDPQPKRKT